MHSDGMTPSAISNAVQALHDDEWPLNLIAQQMWRARQDDRRQDAWVTREQLREWQEKLGHDA